jgi:SAM-dependent methyltransferase
MVWALSKLYYGRHKPVILYGDFWDPLIESFQKSMYLDELELGVLYQATTPEQVLNILQAHEKKIEFLKEEPEDSDEVAFIIRPEVARTIRSYNRIATNYHAVHAGKLVSQEQLDEFISLTNPPAKVLDIGTGPGYDLKYLASKYTVKGIEPSKRFFEIAKLENPHLSIEHVDITNAKLGTNVYKGIWARDSLHHVPGGQLESVFTKIAAALVEGGIFYVIVREGEGEIIEEEQKSYDSVKRFYHLFTAKELIERAEAAGLELVKIDRNKRSHDWVVGVFRKSLKKLA